MGQYWIPVNLDKKEFIDPHKLGTGLKLWEQLANHPGTGAALIILTAVMLEKRGGGDFDLDENWHGPERKFPEHNVGPGPMPESYPEIAVSIIGRWAGDRIAIIGDYAEDGDLPPEFEASKIYKRCRAKEEKVWTKEPVEGKLCIRDMTPDSERYGEYYHFEEVLPPEYRDISEAVCAVIEHELNGKFQGDGWREFVRVEGEK